MKGFRIFAGTLASLVLLNPAWADVRTLHASAKLVPPTDRAYTSFGQAVAINGNSIIVVAGYDGGQAALLYQQSGGRWNYRRVLTSVTGPEVRTSVRMKNSIAAVQFGDAISIFEYSGGDYVAGPSAAPIRHPGGLAISGNSILIGGDDCDYDAVVYQKGTDGNWGITGRLDDNAGACSAQGLDVELNYDYALLRVPSTGEVHAWRRNGTALDWVRAGDLNLPADSPTFDAAPALQNSTAVTPGNVVFRRSGTTWTQQGTVKPVDYAMGTIAAHDLKFRDGVLVTVEFWAGGHPAHPNVYLETTSGQFEHFAFLHTDFYTTTSVDVSGRSVVVATERPPAGEVLVFSLPAPLEAPPPILDDFEDHDTSDFSFLTLSGAGQYSVATRGTDEVLEMNHGNGGLGIALLQGSESNGQQQVEADITPSFALTRGWVGLVARYIDANNYYYVAIRRDRSFDVFRRQNGVDTRIADGTSLGDQPTHVSIVSDSTGVHVEVRRQDNSLNDRTVVNVKDTTFRQGRAGLITYATRADFDDVHFTATEPITLAFKDYDSYGFDFGQPFSQRGGNWQFREAEDGEPYALSQLDLGGYALATLGTPVESQDITSFARLDSFGSAGEGAWFGLLGRYVDASTYYYVAVRNSNQILIRKKVNGVSTTLASASYTPTPGDSDYFRFRLIGDVLEAYVNGVLLASAHDSEIPRGIYGIGTYRAAATWSNIKVVQP